MELKDHFPVEDIIMYALGIPGIKNISGSFSLQKNVRRMLRIIYAQLFCTQSLGKFVRQLTPFAGAKSGCPGIFLNVSQ